MEIELSYDGKEPEKEIIKSVEPASLKLKKMHGEEQGGWVNKLIFGDNLAVLKNLCENPDVKGKVRLVYIDPPFATGREFKTNNGKKGVKQFSNAGEDAYVDSKIGAEYLEFLRKRLVLLRELLADDGSIYVHIDLKMGHYVKVIMDEVFDRHFINDISRIKCNPKNFERAAYGNIKDMILFYSKTNNYVWNGSYTDFTEEDIKRLFPKKDEKGRRYTTVPLHAPGETINGATGQEWKGMEPPNGRHWRYAPERLTELDKQKLIEWSSSGNPRLIKYADDAERSGKKRQDIWKFKDPAYPSYPTEKNLDMLKTIVSASSNEDDIVLDCFAGSGTTLVAAEQLGRRWIGIDNSGTAISEAQSRLSTIITQPYAVYEQAD